MKVQLSSRIILNDKYPFDEEKWFLVLVNGKEVIKTKDKNEVLVGYDKVCAFIEKHGTIPADYQFIAELKNVKKK